MQGIVAGPEAWWIRLEGNGGGEENDLHVAEAGRLFQWRRSMRGSVT